MPTFTVWSPECIHPASQPPTFTVYTNNAPDSPHLHPGYTHRPKGLVPHPAKPTARFHLLNPDCPSCVNTPSPCSPKGNNLLRTPDLYRLLGGSTRSLGSLSSSSTTRGGSISSGEDSNKSFPLTVEELQYAISAALNACTDTSNLHGPASDSLKNARLAARLHSLGKVLYLLFFSLLFSYTFFAYFLAIYQCMLASLFSFLIFCVTIEYSFTIYFCFSILILLFFMQVFCSHCCFTLTCTQ